jgi:hypothetical protein
MFSKLALFLLMACVAFCEEASPSLPATIKFLTDKINLKGNLEFKVDTSVSESAFDIVATKVTSYKNGILVISVSRQALSSARNSLSKKVTTYSIPLLEIDPSLVKVKIWNSQFTDPREHVEVRINTRSERAVIVKNEGGRETKTPLCVILVEDEDSAERIVRALKHAVKLSGGKEELF